MWLNVIIILFITMPDLDELISRRSQRVRKAPDRFNPCAATSVFSPTSLLFHMVCLTSIFTFGMNSVGNTIFSKAVYHTHLINQHFDGTLNYLNPLAFAAELSDNDTYTFKEMLQQSDKNEFIQAMLKEIQDHENRKHCTYSLDLKFHLNIKQF